MDDQPTGDGGVPRRGLREGCVLVAMSIRTDAWVNARLPLVTILIFTVLTLVATLVHIDRFHFSAAGDRHLRRVVLAGRLYRGPGAPPRRPRPAGTHARNTSAPAAGDATVARGTATRTGFHSAGGRRGHLCRADDRERRVAVAVDPVDGTSNRGLAHLVRPRGTAGDPRELPRAPANLLTGVRRLRSARTHRGAALSGRAAPDEPAAWVFVVVAAAIALTGFYGYGGAALPQSCGRGQSRPRRVGSWCPARS